MTSRRAATTCGSDLEIHRDIPVAELRAFLVDQFLPVACVGRMADEAGAPFPAVYDVNVVEILLTVAELGVYRGFCESEEILLMTLQAEIIRPFLVRSIEGVGEIPPQHPDNVGTVRIVTGGALPLLYGAVKVLFPLQFLLDVLQGGGAEIVLAVAVETDRHIIGRK